MECKWMPPPLLFDLSGVDLDRIVADKNDIRRVNPQRYEFEQLDGVVYCDLQQRIILGLRDVKPDEWWARGHLPERPLFPGVLMIEAAAQLAGYFTKKLLGDPRFIGFGGVDKVKFREVVVPPARMYILAKAVDLRPRRTICDVQELVNGRLVFEGRVTGVPM
jgi:3-hydroxyacyl-[acyl-carrier-protein] dehydratase